MAWEKDIVLENDVVVRYWELEKAFLNLPAGSIEVSYRGWVSKDSKDNGKAPVVSSNILIPIGDNPQLVGEISAYLTSEILAQEIFSGAVEA